MSLTASFDWRSERGDTVNRQEKRRTDLIGQPKDRLSPANRAVFLSAGNEQFLLGVAARQYIVGPLCSVISTRNGQLSRRVAEAAEQY
ncbi:MAG: hypothetical protein RMJ19_04500, partial [Gemmatales bacterium]|nr:hypothetical protein [Gemmatales bacterium]MDW8174909.1 hypothetical protein [Gemmatales bacterium]